jgi:hypothetical protein
MHYGFGGVVELGDKAGEWAGATIGSAKVIAAAEAFRKYNWIRGMPVMNSVGNLRGMVVSGRWAAVFHFAENSLKPVERVAVFASLAANLYGAKDEVDRIFSGNDDWTVKGARLSTQVSSICLRTALGGVPFGAHLIARSLGGYLQLADLAGLHQAGQWNRTLQRMDQSGQSMFDRATDGNNMYLYVNRNLVFR